MSEALKQAIETLAALMPANRYLQALILIAVAAILAKIVDWLITAVISAWTRRTETELDDRLIAALHRPLFLSVFLIGLWLAVLKVAPAAPYDRLLLGLIKTLAILVWMVFAVRASGLLLETLSRTRATGALIEPRIVALLQNAAKLILVGGAIYYLLVSWGIHIGPWLAGAGVMGLALGLAAQDTLSNLFSGIFILADAPYKVGDFVNLDSGERGEVKKIGLRSTRLLTRDDIEITIPNAVIAASKIVNESGGPSRQERIRLKVGVAYGTDVDRVRELLLAAAHDDPHISHDPAPRVRFRSFGESALEFELMGWIDEAVLRGRVLDRLHTEVYKRFTTEEIEIPYAKRDLYIRELPTGLGAALRPAPPLPHED